jgi:hypothetical protein
MKEQLKKLPETIKEMRLQLLIDASMITSLQKRIKEWEAAEMQSITDITDNGKAVFSNDAKRQAELLKRKVSNSVIKSTEDSLTKMQLKYEESKIELMFHVDMQENYRAIARLGGGEQ